MSPLRPKQPRATCPEEIHAGGKRSKEMKSLTPSFLCAAVLTILIAQTAPAFNYN